MIRDFGLSCFLPRFVRRYWTNVLTCLVYRNRWFGCGVEPLKWDPNERANEGIFFVNIL